MGGEKHLFWLLVTMARRGKDYFNILLWWGADYSLPSWEIHVKICYSQANWGKWKINQQPVSLLHQTDKLLRIWSSSLMGVFQYFEPAHSDLMPLCTMGVGLRFPAPKLRGCPKTQYVTPENLCCLVNDTIDGREGCGNTVKAACVN